MSRTSSGAQGFTLLEVVITAAIIAILAAIAFPMYQDYVTRANRAAATACMTEGAHFMERNYTLNMRYDEMSDGSSVGFPSLDCATQLEPHYALSLESVSANQYEIQAVPQGLQASRDEACGTLSLDQTGRRRVSGGADVNRCW